MSASKQKKVRTEQRSEGLDKKYAAASEKAAKDRKFRRNTIIAVVIIVLIIAAAAVINSTLFYTGIDAVVIDGTGYSAAEVSFYYSATVNSYYQTYGSYASLFGVDFSQPLDEQLYLSSAEGDDYTWADYFYESALSQMVRDTAFYNEAMANGFTLSDEEEAAIEENMAGFEAAAAAQNYKTDKYLSLVFGKGVDSDLVRELVTRQTIASAYSTKINNDFSYTDEELKTYYSEHADELDYFLYQTYTVSTSADAYTELEDDEAKAAAARADADTVAEATTVEEFAEAVSALQSDKDAMLKYADAEATRAITQGQSLGEDIREWMLSADRKEGDTMVYDTTSGSTVVMFVSRDDNNYNTVDMRHILIKTEADENGEYTDEAREAAKAAVEDIYAQWQEDPTEENFIALTSEYSEDVDDSGAVYNDGLYEIIYHNALVDEINEFLFNSGAQPGDTAICYGSSSYYDGYHLIYYVGENTLYCDYLADTALRNADYTAYYDALLEGIEPVEKFGAKFIEF